MTYDLRSERWIPWRRRSGIVEWGPPSALVSRMQEDPVVGLAASRPDFAGALQEFAIGLLNAALEPKDESAWRDLWRMPPTEAELQAAIEALPNAFDLDGDGARFFQDLSVTDFSDAALKPIDQLLIDSPGEQGLNLNKDLFIKRARMLRLGRPAAAAAIIAMQTYAPAGGQGYRTSLRGGGPLTTLIDPRVDGHGGVHSHDQPLWEKLWANVETRVQQEARTPSTSRASSIELAFPWLAPTRTSNMGKGGLSTTPSDVHPLQAYFGLPRRVRLEFGEAGMCDLTGLPDERPVAGFRTLNYGVKYEGWKHPLSPHYRTKLTEPWLPMHGQPGGVIWRDWISLTLESPTSELRVPANVVADFQRRAREIRRRQFRVHVFGYDMDNMKARGWTESLLPAFAVDDQERRDHLRSTARSLVEATSITGAVLLQAVKTALFQSPDDASGDLGQVKLELWSATEAHFYAAMRDLADESLDGEALFSQVDDLRRAFARQLEREATAVFDRWCPIGGLDVDGLRRRVSARYQLTSALHGYTKLGESIFAQLGIAPPGGGREARGATKPRKPKEKTT